MYRRSNQDRAAPTVGHTGYGIEPRQFRNEETLGKAATQAYIGLDNVYGTTVKQVLKLMPRA
jgi:hypothetical protein